MSSKRSAVEPSECENVAKKSKKIKKEGKILNQGIYQRSKISALRHGKKKRINAGALQ